MTSMLKYVILQYILSLLLTGKSRGRIAILKRRCYTVPVNMEQLVHRPFPDTGTVLKYRKSEAMIMENAVEKKRILSGIQPSGDLTLGSYLLSLIHI